MSTTDRLIEAPFGSVLTPVPLARTGGGTPGPSATLRRILVGLDIGAAAIGWLVGLAITHSVVAPAGPMASLVAVSTVLAATTVVMVAAQRLYLSRVCTIRADEIVRLFRAALLTGLVALVMPRLLPIDIGLDGVVAGVALSLVLLMMERGCYRYGLQAGRRDGRFMRPIVIVGGNDEAYDICRLLHDHPELGFRVAGVVGGPGDLLSREGDVPYLGGLDSCVESVERIGATGVIFAATALPPDELNRLIRSFLKVGVHVHLSSGLRGIDHRRLRSMPLAHEPLFYLEPISLSRWQTITKRVIDLALGTVAGIAALPVLLLAALAIKLQDRGPILYKQSRVGRWGQPFTIYKLRTMRPDAEKLYVQLAQKLAGRDGPLIKLSADPRRTKVGRVLERLSIDELPQLLNVLKGDMSLVGPRPAQQSEVDQFDDELRARDEVRPGITGLWQVEARDNPSFNAYRRYDLFYIENWSVLLDLGILIATVQRVLFRGIDLITGSRGEVRTKPA